MTSNLRRTYREHNSPAAVIMQALQDSRHQHLSRGNAGQRAEPREYLPRPGSVATLMRRRRRPASVGPHYR